jgi:hypothetical protein
MAMYQFLSEIGQRALDAGALLGGCKVIRATLKTIRLDRMKLDLKLPKMLKFSKLEINLTTEKI